MKPSERDQILYLEDILKSMERVAEYIQGLEFQKFREDYKTLDAVLRNFEIIGEASKNLTRDLKSNYPDVPWDDMYSLRNIVSHGYFGIDYKIIWDIATNDLPANQSEIKKVLEIERSKKKQD